MLFFFMYWIVLPSLVAIIISFLINRNKNLATFAAGIFSEANGAPSFGRFGSFLALVAALSWVTRIVWKTNVIPDLWNITFFICALYSINKMAELFVALKAGRAPTGANPVA